MALFKITSTTSKLSTTATDAFDQTNDTPAADTLIVETAGFLVNTNGAGGDGAQLNSTLAWTVTVNGMIYSDTDDGLFP